MNNEKASLDRLTSETRNKNSMNIDRVPTLEMMRIINNEDKTVAYAVESQLKEIAKVVDMTADVFKKGGRLIYCGCGTAGRMGILDASECPPTFGVPYDMVIGLIAGGETAIRKAVEGAEDDFDLCEKELQAIDFCSNDIFIGISASGRAPYVIGGLRYARSIGVPCVSVVCNEGSPMGNISDIAIVTVVGPEALTGSTRMKSGTAQKMVLNMITTGSMIRIGKAYENLMVDVKPSNGKLVVRSKRIIQQATGCSEAMADRMFYASDGNAKLAIVMVKYDLSRDEAEAYLIKNDDMIRENMGTLQ